MSVCLIFAAGCAPRVPYALSSDDARRFAAAVVRLHPDASDPGRQVVLGLDDCAVYRAVTDGDRIVDWTPTLKSEGAYPFFMTGCSRQSIALTRDGKTARAELCRLALGAGGGCTDYAEARTRDGSKWVR